MFDTAMQRIMSQQFDLSELIACAEKLKVYGQKQRIVDLYKAWIAFNADHPVAYAVYFNYGMSLAELPDVPGSINALREAIRLKADFSPPYINLGNILERLGRTDQAVTQWLNLVGQFPSVTGDAVNYKTMALKQIGRVLETAGTDAPAEDALRQSLDANPEQPEVSQHWISLRQRQCKWPLMVGLPQIKKSKLVAAISPLSAACYTDDPMFQLAHAARYHRNAIGMPLPPGSANMERPPRAPGRIRVAYVSSDLRHHAVGFGIPEIFETHDRQSFEIFAFYCGIPGTDYSKERIKRAVDHWIDISEMTDEQAHAKIKENHIDIVVDLNGYTKDARTKVFGMRGAPIVVNWFGYPATMGTPYHNYIIADAQVVPEDAEIYYSEKVLRLPCYQPNDRKRVVSTRQQSRQEQQLPEDAVVFCCLNGLQKLTAITFQRWMTILSQVPGSVLWLLGAAPETNERVRQLATAQGVGPERIVFADKRANPEHVARYALADLFLDNFPYGAHTTAADSIWMGVPILTTPGRTFASRVCASLVRAAGIGDLVCATPDVYVTRAIELGRDRQKLAAYKQKLLAGRDTCLLFDTPLLVRHLEDLYRQMMVELEEGRLPVPDLSNLDIYHEIGCELDLDQSELLTDKAYRALYHEKLVDWNANYPIRPDNRFWPAGQ
jgi:predicted O-linked N-acetylglucosamine transferase (SPINDLY family)